MAWSVRGGASGVRHEELVSCSCVAVTRVVRVPSASITSCKVGLDSSSDDRRSGGGLALFLILVMGAFFVSFIRFSLGTRVQYRIVQERAQNLTV